MPVRDLHQRVQEAKGMKRVVKPLNVLILATTLPSAIKRGVQSPKQEIATGQYEKEESESKI